MGVGCCAEERSIKVKSSKKKAYPQKGNIIPEKPIIEKKQEKIQDKVQEKKDDEVAEHGGKKPGIPPSPVVLSPMKETPDGGHFDVAVHKCSDKEFYMNWMKEIGQAVGSDMEADLPSSFPFLILFPPDGEHDVIILTRQPTAIVEKKMKPSDVTARLSRVQFISKTSDETQFVVDLSNFINNQAKRGYKLIGCVNDIESSRTFYLYFYKVYDGPIEAMEPEDSYWYVCYPLSANNPGSISHILSEWAGSQEHYFKYSIEVYNDGYTRLLFRVAILEHRQENFPSNYLLVETNIMDELEKEINVDHFNHELVGFLMNEGTQYTVYNIYTGEGSMIDTKMD